MLLRSWMRRGVLAWLLAPLALVFYAATRLRRAMFAAGLAKSTRLPVPVIVVGNVFVGGTGKTPFTIWLTQVLRAAGYAPGVVSRGYGTQGAGTREVLAGAQASEVGDEPLLIARRSGCPVMVGRDRAAAGQALLAAHPEIDIILSDDGLQHYALHRDMEIILFDERGVGNGWVLPAGPLREPASRRRDFTVVNLGSDSAPAAAGGGLHYMRLVGERAERLADPAQTVSLSEFAAGGKTSGLRFAAAAGIGNPARFFALLRGAGLVFTELPLPDHYDFSDNPFAGLEADIILITEKDAVKCAQLETLRTDPRIWVVPVAARIDGALAKHILEKCRGRTTA